MAATNQAMEGPSELFMDLVRGIENPSQKQPLWIQWNEFITDRSKLKRFLRLAIEDCKDKHPYCYLDPHILDLKMGKSISSTQLVVIYTIAGILDPDRSRAWSIMNAIAEYSGDIEPMVRSVNRLCEFSVDYSCRNTIKIEKFPISIMKHCVDLTETGDEAPIPSSPPSSASPINLLEVKNQELEIQQNYIARLEELNAKHSERIASLERSLEGIMGTVYGSGV